MAAKKKATKKAAAPAAAAPGAFKEGDRVRVVREGKHLGARGVVWTVDGPAVNVKLNRPKGRHQVEAFAPGDLERLA